MSIDLSTFASNIPTDELAMKAAYAIIAANPQTITVARSGCHADAAAMIYDVLPKKVRRKLAGARSVSTALQELVRRGIIDTSTGTYEPGGEAPTGIKDLTVLFEPA